jgi:hypothetical protein
MPLNHPRRRIFYDIDLYHSCHPLHTALPRRRCITIMLSPAAHVASSTPPNQQHLGCSPRHHFGSCDKSRSHPSSGTPTNSKRSLDFTQRVERKLAEYNASQNVVKRWLFEIISWSVSLACMIGVVCIYAYLRDKPIQHDSLLWYANALGRSHQQL